MAILYSKSLANLVVEVETRHSHQSLLFRHIRDAIWMFFSDMAQLIGWLIQIVFIICIYHFSPSDTDLIKYKGMKKTQTIRQIISLVCFSCFSC